jgi:hypothetical protein
MLKKGRPVTREVWEALNYMGHLPSPWTAEHEAAVPPPFRDESRIERD